MPSTFLSDVLRRARSSAFLLPTVLLIAAAPPSPARACENKNASTSAYGTSSDRDHFSWAVSSGGSQSFSMSDFDDWKTVGTMMKQSEDGMLWFRLDGKTYAVRDREMVTRAQTAVKPMADLGKKQGEWGSKQGRYGAEQSRLGAQQARLAARMTSLQMRIDALSRQFAASGRDDADLRRLQSDLNRNVSELGQVQGELGRQQSELGRALWDLGRVQADLGRQQESAAREANQKLEALAREAIAKGKAEALTTN